VRGSKQIRVYRRLLVTAVADRHVMLFVRLVKRVNIGLLRKTAAKRVVTSSLLGRRKARKIFLTRKIPKVHLAKEANRLMRIAAPVPEKADREAREIYLQTIARLPKSWPRK